MFVAVTKDAYDRLRRAAVIGDLTTVNQMVAAGQLLLVRSGTKVFVLDVGFSFFVPTDALVRMLDGTYAGRTGWLTYDVLKK